MANTSVIFTPGLCECQVGSGAETNNGPPGLHAAFAILYKLSFLLCDTLHQSTSKLHMDSQDLWGSGLLRDACTRLEAAENEPLPLLKPAWCLRLTETMAVPIEIKPKLGVTVSDIALEPSSGCHVQPCTWRLPHVLLC